MTPGEIETVVLMLMGAGLFVVLTVGALLFALVVSLCTWDVVAACRAAVRWWRHG